MDPTKSLYKAAEALPTSPAAAEAAAASKSMADTAETPRHYTDTSSRPGLPHVHRPGISIHRASYRRPPCRPFLRLPGLLDGIRLQVFFRRFRPPLQISQSQTQSHL